jgi:recombinational DNA repair protein (RecF pathway)
MLDENINLNKSRDISGYTQTCSRCDTSRPTDDGVYMGQGKWVCGKCWRKRATRPTGAMAALAAEKRWAK